MVAIVKDATLRDLEGRLNSVFLGLFWTICGPSFSGHGYPNQRAANTSCPRSGRFWLLELRVSRTFLDQLRPQLLRPWIPSSARGIDGGPRRLWGVGSGAWSVKRYLPSFGFTGHRSGRGGKQVTVDLSQASVIRVGPAAAAKPLRAIETIVELKQGNEVLATKAKRLEFPDAPVLIIDRARGLGMIVQPATPPVIRSPDPQTQSVPLVIGGSLQTDGVPRGAGLNIKPPTVPMGVTATGAGPMHNLSTRQRGKPVPRRCSSPRQARATTLASRESTRSLVKPLDRSPPRCDWRAMAPRSSRSRS